MIANCWICEGWSSQRIEFVIGRSGELKNMDPNINPLLIHFEHENWKPRLVEFEKVEKFTKTTI